MKFPALALAVALALALACGPAWAAAPTTSPQWVDVTAHGADPTDTADSTAALNTSINLALTGGQPLYLPYGTSKVGALTIDYSGIGAVRGDVDPLRRGRRRRRKTTL